MNSHKVEKLIIHNEGRSALSVYSGDVDYISTRSSSGENCTALTAVNGVGILLVNDDSNSLTEIILPESVSVITIDSSFPNVSCTGLKRVSINTTFGNVNVVHCETVKVKNIHGDITLDGVNYAEVSTVHGNINANDVKSGFGDKVHGEVNLIDSNGFNISSRY